ncbi:MAG: hypothetical protein J2P50_04140 [Hyphomicrobiaceae bacterium]|nr:hypothetical protein [Hyphomicrobiaceae bacterium]
MNARHIAGLLIAAALAATAVLADVNGVPNPPSFSAEETQLISRDPRLAAAAKEHPWHLRCALDAWNDLRRGVRRPAACPELPPDPGRASTEGPFDLLQILKEAAGGGTKR